MRSGRRGRPRVAIVTHEVSSYQGIGRSIGEVIRRAADRIDFVVISRELDDDLRSLVAWRRVWAPDRPYRLKVLAFALLGGARIWQARADLVHVHASGPTVLNRADVTSVHFARCAQSEASGSSAEGSKGPRAVTKLHWRIERFCFRRSRALAALSPAGKSELEQLFPGPTVVVTPNGVDRARFRPDADRRREVRAQEGVGDDETVVLFVGNAWRHKGLAETIEAFALMEVSPSLPSFLWVVGYGDTVRYGALAEARRVADRVRFFGLQQNVERFYQAADILVCPSRYESFCLVAYEAAACGIPVVGTPVGGVADLVGDNEAGVITDREPAAVADALRRLAGDAELRSRMGAEGERRASTYTWEQATASVLAVYSARIGLPL